MFVFILFFIGPIYSKKYFQKLEVQEKDEKGVRVQIAYRRQVQTNLQTDNLLMFDAEIGRPKYFRKFHRWLLIDFDLLILWILILKNLLALKLQVQYLKLCISDIQFFSAECKLLGTSFLKFLFLC